LLARLVVQPDWHRDAACAGTEVDLFFGSKANKPLAIAICASCTVRVECASEAIDDERHVSGVFGVRAGLTAEQRQARLRSAAARSMS
jgi:hypothetical protein